MNSISLSDLVRRKKQLNEMKRVEAYASAVKTFHMHLDQFEEDPTRAIMVYDEGVARMFRDCGFLVRTSAYNSAFSTVSVPDELQTRGEAVWHTPSTTT